MRDTAGEVGTNPFTTYSSGRPHIVEQMQDDQLEPIFNSSVLIQGVALKTHRERWTIEKDSGRGSGRSVLVAQHDDDGSWRPKSRVTQRFPFQLLLLWGVGKGATLFRGLLNFTLYPYRIMLSLKQGCKKSHFLSL